MGIEQGTTLTITELRAQLRKTLLGAGWSVADMGPRGDDFVHKFRVYLDFDISEADMVVLTDGQIGTCFQEVLQSIGDARAMRRELMEVCQLEDTLAETLNIPISNSNTPPGRVIKKLLVHLGRMALGVKP